MTRHILLLCLLGNPFELNLGGHQRTVLEIIEHFKDMPRLEISNVLLKCNVLIMHSAFEPGGRVILEAMSAGKPVIATYSGFGNNYVQDWYNGFHVEYGDFEKLSRYLELFIINPYLSNMLGINSKNLFWKISKNWDYFQRISDLYFYFGTSQYTYSRCAESYKSK